MQEQKVQNVTFRVKIEAKDIKKVYFLLKSKKFFDQNDFGFEMKLEENQNNLKIYKCSINIDPEVTYFYRYKFQEKLEDKICLMEEDFVRSFKFDNKFDHQIDEWNKQWNIIKFHWNYQEFIDEFNKVINLNIQQQQQCKKENQLSFECKRLQNNQESFKQLKFKQVEGDTNVQKVQEFEVNIQQQIKMNFTIQKLNFINLGKLLAEQIHEVIQFQMMSKQESESQNQLINQLKKESELKELEIQKIKKLNQQTIQELQQQFSISQRNLETQYLNLQNFSSQNILQYTNTIHSLQSQILELSQSQLNFKFQQILIQKFEVEELLKSYSDVISKELLDHLRKYQNSLEKLEQLQQEKDLQMENKQKSISFMKNINQQLKQKFEESENYLNEIEIKLQKSENNNQEQKFINERNQKLLKTLYQKLQIQKIDLNKCKNALSDLENKLQETELKNQSLQQSLVDLQQQFDNERQQNNKKVEQIIKQNEQNIESIDLRKIQDLAHERIKILFQQGLEIQDINNQDQKEIKVLKEKIGILQLQIQQFQISNQKDQRDLEERQINDQTPNYIERLKIQKQPNQLQHRELLFHSQASKQQKQT